GGGKEETGEGEGKEKGEGVRTFAGVPTRVWKVDRGGFKPEPLQDHQVVPVLVVDAQELVPDPSGDHAEVPEPCIERGSQERVQHSKVRSGREAARPRVACSNPARQDDVETLSRPPIQDGELLGRILKIAVHHCYSLAARVFEPGRDRCMLSEVAAQPDDLDAGVLVGKR